MIESEHNKTAKSAFLKIGILLYVLSVLVNATLVKYGIEGISRDLARLCVMITLLMVISGLILKVKTYFQKREKEGSNGVSPQNYKK